MNLVSSSDIHARVIVITGSNTGIGRAAALQLAAPGKHLILANRSRDKTEPVLAQLRAKGAEATFLPLDLGDLRAATRAGEALRDEFHAVDAIINNAGLAGTRGLTRDGFELAFGTNHLGHFAFCAPMLDRLADRGGVMVNVSSGNHYRADTIPFDELREKTRTRTGLPEYSVSKLCNVLYTAELRRRYPSLRSVSVHPGRIRSDVWRSVPEPVRTLLPFVLRMETVEVGGDALVRALRAAEGAEHTAIRELPLYFHQFEIRDVNPAALDLDLAQRLWRYSEAAMPSSSSRRVEEAHGATA
jgi:NAD(P)-dependent dehydrogenase (short-subunit alcohol dehydrogenase family)